MLSRTKDTPGNEVRSDDPTKTLVMEEQNDPTVTMVMKNSRFDDKQGATDLDLDMLFACNLGLQDMSIHLKGINHTM